MAAALALLASLAMTMAAHAESLPGSSEALSVSAPKGGVGEPVTVTVSGIADGAHHLVVDGAYLEAGQGHSPACAPAQAEGTRTLTPSGGETLSPGPFETHFTVVPKHECDFFVSAYLEIAGNRYPDAWAYDCLAWWEETSPGVWSYISCVHPALDFTGLLAAEEQGQRIIREEEQQRSEREAQERAAAEENARAAKRREEQEAARCHVPRLLGHTLADARRLLGKAHCRLGAVTPRHRPRGVLRVRWQRPGKGGSYPAGAAVAVRVSR